MDLNKSVWLPFNPHESYTRRYNNHFYSEFSIYISGRVLDLGASANNEEEYKHLSDDLKTYISADISRNSTLDVLADGRELPFKSSSIDTVVLSAVLEHVPIQDVSKLLDEVKRVLSPEGAVLAYIPFIYPIHGAPYDYYRPTYYGIYSLFSDCGFDTKISVGGGLGETILHTIFTPFLMVTNVLNLDELKWLFVIPHLIMKHLSKFIGKTVKAVGRESILDKWYIGQFVVGKNQT